MSAMFLGSYQLTPTPAQHCRVSYTGLSEVGCPSCLVMTSHLQGGHSCLLYVLPSEEKQDKGLHPLSMPVGSNCAADLLCHLHEGALPSLSFVCVKG